MKIFIFIIVIALAGVFMFKNGYIADNITNGAGVWVFDPETTCTNGKPDDDPALDGKITCGIFSKNYTGKFMCASNHGVRPDGRDILEVRCN